MTATGAPAGALAPLPDGSAAALTAVPDGSAGALVAALGGPVTRDGAREEARRELSRSIYGDNQPDWFSRLIDWINGQLGDLWDWLTPDADAGGVGGFTGLGVLAIVLVIVALAIVIRVWLGPVRRTARDRGDEVGLSSPLTAAALRAQAERHAGRGEYAEAVRSRLRAIVRMLEERGVLDPRPGRTAGELVGDVRAVTSEPAAELAAAVDVFSEVWYGGRPATEQSYQTLVTADRELERVRRGGRDGSDHDSRPIPA